MNDPVDIESSARGPVPKQVVEAVLQSWGGSGKGSLFIVNGESMLPFLVPGDNLLIIHGWERVHPGRLIAYRKDGSLVVHRLLRVYYVDKERFLLLKGDNCNNPDPPVAANQLVGRVCTVRRGEKSYDLETPAWWFVSIIIVIFARLTLTIERTALIAMRIWSVDTTRINVTKLHQMILKVFSMPGRCLSVLAWRFSRQ